MYVFDNTCISRFTTSGFTNTVMHLFATVNGYLERNVKPLKLFQHIVCQQIGIGGKVYTQFRIECLALHLGMVNDIDYHFVKIK